MNNFLNRWPVEFALAGIALMAYVMGIGGPSEREYFTLLLLLVLGIIALARSYYYYSDQPGGLDIWSPQYKVMAISGQNIPKYPEVTKDSFLYYALILEEAGELAEALRAAVPCTINSDLNTDVRVELQKAAYALRLSSRQLRDLVAQMHQQGFTIYQDTRYLVPILDGITDLAVVTAGFSVASGLPAREGYDEVVGSNLSKADPVSGRILRDAGGKWIKGPNYRAPQLRRVIWEAYKADRGWW